jgi:hypothetical protein
MSLDAHLSELRKKHETLSKIIEDEQRHPSADDLSIKQMKRQKLHLKEEIERLSSQL